MHEPVYYNAALADQRGLSHETRVALDVVYEQMFAVLSHPEMHGEPKNISDIVAGFEYVLQALWGFPLDPKFHRYHLEIKGCTCPIFDNYELIGHTTSRWTTSDCPFHGVSDEV